MSLQLQILVNKNLKERVEFRRFEAHRLATGTLESWWLFKFCHRVDSTFEILRKED